MMSTYLESLKAIRAARVQRDQAAVQQYRLSLERRQLVSALQAAERNVPRSQRSGISVRDESVPDPTAQLKKKIDENSKALATSSTVLSRNKDFLSNQIGGLLRVNPQQLLEQWTDQFPILLMPLRLEIRFHDGGGKTELWVRVFPDDIAIASHEKTLTSTEVEFGQSYWQLLWAANDQEDNKRAAWKQLADKFGSNRAAWVALQTKPLNWSTLSPKASLGDFIFPVLDFVKPESWSEAPHTRVLPDRLVLMAFRKGQDAAVVEQVGAQIPDVLAVGPNPLNSNAGNSITRDANGNLVYEDDLKWIADFQTAVHVGMAFVIPLSAEDAALGFDQLVVVGVKHSSDEQDSKKLLENLIDDHHFSPDGFSIVPLGTATNNTDGKESGFSSRDPFKQLSYLVETGPPLFTVTTDKSLATDGQRLAEYLGIEYEPLQFVAGADAADNKEAVAMNQALYAGTAGYFFHNMLNIFPDSVFPVMREHFTSLVTGRGPLPAIRVGRQPYGIVLTSRFDQLQFSWPNPILSRLSALEGKEAFVTKLYQVLLFLQQQWQSKLPTVGYLSKPGDPHANLMNVLGLQPSSAAFFQRTAYSFDNLTNHGDFGQAMKFLRDLELHTIEVANSWSILQGFGYSKHNSDGSPKPIPLLFQMIFQHFTTELDRSNLVDPLPVSEQNSVAPLDQASTKTYFDWLLETTDPAKIEKEDFGGKPSPSSLLFLMLRYSMLHTTNESIANLLLTNGISSEELQRSRTFLNLSKAAELTHWEVFGTPVNEVLPGNTSKLPLYSYVHAGLLDHRIETQNLNAFKAAISVLKDIPTARLERAFISHLDSLIYRLDCWQTSLFDLKLQQKRNLTSSQQHRTLGVYLGAFGYLENVKRASSRRVSIAEDVLPEIMRKPKTGNLFVEPANGGFFQTPSLSHASASAMLRNGYLTYSNSTEPNLMSVNLSSERVRRALFLLEGVRNGQRLETLLGYQFERGLHDAFSNDGINLNPYLPLFRTAFPIRSIRIPNPGASAPPQETVEDFSVVNGVMLANHDLPFPYGIPELTALSATEIGRIKQEKDNLENSLDALQDLITSESLYQLALGNFDRAASVIQAIGDSHIHPEIEGIGSSRGTDQIFTHRVAIQFDPQDTGNPWASPLTIRAKTEPALNNWLAHLIGDPSEIRCLVKALDSAGTVTDSAVISLADLAIQPLDFVSLILETHQNGASELEMRVRYAFCQPRGILDDVNVNIIFADSGSGGDPSVKAFAEIWSLCRLLKKLLGNSRSVQARDFDSSSKSVAFDKNNPGNVDLAGFRTKVVGLYTYTATLATKVQNASTSLVALKSAAAADQLRLALTKIAETGLSDCFPVSSTGFSQDAIDRLVAQASSVQSRWAAILDAHQKKLVALNAPSTSTDSWISGLVESGKALLGKDFILLPVFKFNDPSDMDACYQSRSHLFDYCNGLGRKLIVEGWQHGVSLVRDRMHTLEMIRLLNDNFSLLSGSSDDPVSMEPMQIPFRSGDNWLGVEFPEGTVVYHDTISLVAHLPVHFDPRGPQAGLLVDEWTENIPQSEGVTGIGFNYDQPTSMPAQSLLLAVSPSELGHWTWDGLVGSILDTFSRAKLRAIEPDQLNQTGLTTLLPAIWAEFSTSGANLSLDYALNLKALATQVTQLNLSTIKAS